MSDSDSNDVQTEPLEAASSGTPPEASSGPGKADNSGAVEANEPNPDLPLIKPAAD